MKYFKVMLFNFVLITTIIAQPSGHPRLLIFEEDLSEIRSRAFNINLVAGKYYQQMTLMNNHFIDPLTPTVLAKEQLGVYSNMALGYLIEKEPDPSLANAWADKAIEVKSFFVCKKPKVLCSYFI